MLLISGTNLGLLQGAVDQIAVLFFVQALADDAGGRENRKVGGLPAKILNGALPLLLDLSPSPGDDAFGVLPRLRLQLFAQVLSLFRDAVKNSLPLAPRLLEPGLVLARRRLALPHGLLGGRDTFLDPPAARLEKVQQRSPRQPVENAKGDQENDQLGNQRPVDGQQAGLERDHLTTIWPRSGLAKIRNRPRPRPMIGSASMNPMPMTISVNRRPCSS